MATLGATLPTLVDVAKRLDPDGRIAAVAELLSQSNEILMDMPWYEGNLPTGHRLTMRTSLPTASWRLLNAGVAPSKSTTAQSDEQCGMLEAYSEVDKDLAELNGNVSAFRLSEAKAFIEAMNQEMAQTLFYGNSGTAPEEFTGLAQRYNSLSGITSQNVISGGGSGADNASLWLVGWSEQGVFGIYPKGSKAGLFHEDLGLDTVQASSAAVGGNRMRAYLDHWQWKCGVALKDWRYAVRIPNIDVSNLVAKTSAADLFDLMIKATHRIPSLAACRPVYYMNRTLFQMLDIQGRDDVQTGGQLKYEMVEGKRITSFRGIPVRLVDQLLETEAVVA
jgi:hypothetical protein